MLSTTWEQKRIKKTKRMNPKRYFGCIFSLPHSFGSNVGVVPAGTKDFGKVSTDNVDYHRHQVSSSSHRRAPVENETIGSGRSQRIEEDDKEESRPKFPPFPLLVRLLPLPHFYVWRCNWISLKGLAQSCHRIVFPKRNKFSKIFSLANSHLW